MWPKFDMTMPDFLKFATIMIVFCTALVWGPSAFAACPDPIPDNMVCVSWEAPTQNVNGTFIPDTGPDSIAQYTVYWGFTVSDFDPARSIVITDPDARDFTAGSASINIPRPAGGGDVDVFFVMTATNVQGEESDFSNQVAKVVTFDPNVPEEPTLLDVLINITTS